MDPKVTTSFIPKKPLQPQALVQSRAVGALMLVSIALLVLSILAAGGMFLYQGYLGKAIAAQGAALDRAEAAFEPKLIRDLSRLNSRIKESKQLLAGHVAISPFFELLEKTTLENVSFQSFDFSVQGGKAIVSMKGQARSFADIALQSDTFGKTQQIRDSIFSNLNLDQTGNVVFSLIATIDPSLTLYKNNVPAPIPAENQGVTPGGTL